MTKNTHHNTAQLRWQAQHIWDDYCTLTHRPTTHTTLNTTTMKALTHRLTTHPEHAEHAATYAATTPPCGDKNDTRRLITTLGNKTNYAKARRRHTDTNTPPKPIDYTPGEPPLTPNDLAPLLNTTPDNLKQQNWRTIAWLSEDTIRRRANNYPPHTTLTVTNITNPTPQTHNTPHQPPRGKIGTHHTTAHTSPLDTIDYDKDAHLLYVRGADTAHIIAFHTLAPNGYWDDIKRLVTTTGDPNLDHHYNHLTHTYHWHPNNRTP